MFSRITRHCSEKRSWIVTTLLSSQSTYISRWIYSQDFWTICSISDMLLVRKLRRSLVFWLLFNSAKSTVWKYTLNFVDIGKKNIDHVGLCLGKIEHRVAHVYDDTPWMLQLNRFVTSTKGALLISPMHQTWTLGCKSQVWCIGEINRWIKQRTQTAVQRLPSDKRRPLVDRKSS